MDSEITWAAMQKLLGVNKVTLSALAKQDIAVRGEKRGSYRLETVTQSIEHLRSVASGRAAVKPERRRGSV